VGAESLASALAPPPPSSTPGRLAEEEALRTLLLAAERGDELPALAALPPESAFLDPDLQKIFAAFLRLYEAGTRPTIRQVLAEAADLPAGGEKAAQILLEWEDSPVPPLPEVMRNLKRRWLRSRLRELNRDISEAERRGQSERLADLIAEKQTINGELHGPRDRDAELE